MPVHLVDAPLECVVLGAGRCLENFDSLKDMFMARSASALSLPSSAGSAALTVPGGEVFRVLPNLPVGVFECRASAASTSSPSKAASARTARRRIAGLSAQPRSTAGKPAGSPSAPSAATAASRTSGSSCSVAVATRTGTTCSWSTLARSPSANAACFCHPRVVVVQQRDEGADGHRGPERGCGFGGTPPDRRVEVACRPVPRVGFDFGVARAGDRTRERADRHGSDPCIRVIGDEVS